MLALLTIIGFCSLIERIITGAIGLKIATVVMLLICMTANLGMIKIVKA